MSEWVLDMQENPTVIANTDPESIPEAQYPDAGGSVSGNETAAKPASKPLVSILIPAYNAEEWIADTLRSAIEQTWERKEIILVDDGSTDRTLAIARQFESGQVHVVANPHQGAAAARNLAFSLSQGEYIQYLDADDLIAPDKIARQMAVAAQSEGKRTLYSGCWAEFVYRYYRSEFIPTALWRDLNPVDWLICKMQFGVYMQTGVWLLSRELAEAAGPWDTRLLGDDDGEYFCRVLLASNEVRFVPESRVYYRKSGVNCLSYIGLSDSKMEAQMCSMKLHIQHLRSVEDSTRVRVACVAYLQNWLPFFYPNRPDLVMQAEEIAISLGGKLQAPALSWKVSMFSAIFGPQQAKRAQVSMTRFRFSLIRCWDKMLFQMRARRMRPSL